MFSKKTLLSNQVRKSEEVKKSAGKVVDPKRDTPTRAKVNFGDFKRNKIYMMNHEIILNYLRITNNFIRNL